MDFRRLPGPSQPFPRNLDVLTVAVASAALIRHVLTISNCAIFDAAVGVRMENDLRNLKIDRVGIGSGIKRKHHRVGRGTFPGYRNTGKYRTPSIKQLIKSDLKSTSHR